LIPKRNAFTPGCVLPFNGTLNPAIDNTCGIEGGPGDAATQAQNKAKNNFCPPTASGRDITYKELLDLQRHAFEVPIPAKLDNRKVAEDLGEGKYFSYVALIMNAQYSNPAFGETVNCNMAGNSANDIQIVLVPKAGETDKCRSTIAVMSPHYRPAGWTPQVLNGLRKPVRIRGQLFYDNSHDVCTEKVRPHPERASLWEIHPVYSVEVCKFSDLDQCRKAIDDDAQWQAIQ
jgi:hypothetical protein